MAKPDDEKLTEQVLVRMTAAQHAAFTKVCSACANSPADFLRYLATATTGWFVEHKGTITMPLSVVPTVYLSRNWEQKLTMANILVQKAEHARRHGISFEDAFTKKELIDTVEILLDNAQETNALAAETAGASAHSISAVEQAVPVYPTKKQPRKKRGA